MTNSQKPAAPAKGPAKTTPPTAQDKSRIMSTQAQKTGGQIKKDSFGSRIQSAVDKQGG